MDLPPATIHPAPGTPGPGISTPDEFPLSSPAEAFMLDGETGGPPGTCRLRAGLLVNQGVVMIKSSMVSMLLVCGSLAAQQAPAADQAKPAPAPATAPAKPAADQAKPMSLREALQIALQNNLQVEIAQQARVQTQAGVQTNLGTFDWNFNASAQTSRTKSASNSTSNAQPQTTNTTNTNRSLTLDLAKAFQWGGNLELNYAPAYTYESGFINGAPSGFNGAFTSDNPYNGAFFAKYSQNFLQGFGQEVTTANLVIARKNAEAADYTFQEAIITLVAQTEGQYWQLVSAQRTLDNKKISLDLAQQQLKENQIRLQVGTMAPIDVVSAEAQVAQAEQDIISAQAALENAQDTLARALYPNAQRLGIIQPTDAPDLAHTQLDEDAAVKMALERRVELKAAKAAQEVSALQLTVAQDGVRPQLGAFVTYNGGTSTYETLGPVNTDLAGGKYPGYTVGLKFAMPIENNTAKGKLASARAGLRSSELSVRDEELTITLDVRTSVRNVEATQKAVKAAEKTRYYQEQNLDAERKKFENGMSTNFTVLQVMTNLDTARNNETTAQINYANAVTALERSVGNLLEARNFSIK
jgi:outer membrane protein TolC